MSAVDPVAKRGRRFCSPIGSRQRPCEARLLPALAQALASAARCKGRVLHLRGSPVVGDCSFVLIKR
jgi:hypothetical protein